MAIVYVPAAGVLVLVLPTLQNWTATVLAALTRAAALPIGRERVRRR